MNKRILVQLAAFLLGLQWALQALGAITCNVMVTSIDIVYDPTSPVQNVTTGSYTITCTRLASDPNTFAWQLGVNNGLHSGGGFNRVQRVGGAAGDHYNYDTYRSAGNKWGDTGGTRFTGTLNFGGALTATAYGPFDVIMPGSQTVDPAGTYTDTLTARLRDSAGTTIDTSVFNITVVTTNSCQISVPPGNVSLTYTSFQAGAAAASTSYGVRCTTALPYTMALDAASGTLLGLNYTLSLAPASSGTGTGATQTYTINGSIAGGQAGTCATAACTGSQTRTLTLSW